MKGWQIIKRIAALLYSLVVTFMAGEWAVKYAFMERGYKAVGGEYLFIVAVSLSAYKVINIFLNELEDKNYDDGRKDNRRRSKQK